MKKTILLLLLAITTGYGVSYSQDQNNKVVVNDAEGWRRIGETFVDFTKDRDEVIVMGADRFASLRFRVTEAPIHLMSLEVFYEDGTSKIVKLDTPIAVDTESKIIDLKGSESNVKKVVFVYKTVQNQKDKKAHVELWGLKTNTDKK